MLGKDVQKVKLALAFLLTTRGTPQITYGTELLFENDSRGGDHRMRPDFLGGWKNDSINLFDPAQRSALQTEVFDHTKTLLQFRKNNSVMHTGQLTHYYPDKNTYVYFRHQLDDIVMVILNASTESYTLDWNRFTEVIRGKRIGKEILTQKNISTEKVLTIEGQKAMVIHFNKK